MKRRSFLMSSLSLITVGVMPIGRVFALDIPEDLKANTLILQAMVNTNTPLPNFEFTPDEIVPAIEFLVNYAKKVADEVAAIDAPTWENFYWPLEDAQDKLARAWSPVGHLSSVKDSDELRVAYDKARSLLTDFYTWFGLHKGLYDGFGKLKAAEAFASYNQAQKQAVENALRDFKRSGVGLDAEKAEELTKLNARLAELSTQFRKNRLDAENAFELLVTDKARLKGLSEAALDAAAKSAKDKGKEGWRFTTSYASYIAIMTLAEDRDLRQQMYTARATLASDQGPNANQWDSTEVMTETVDLRLKKAKLLGYDGFAEYVLETRMAESPEQVMQFLNDLLEKARPHAQKELEELREYAKTLGIEELKPWDTEFVATALKKEKYSVDNEQVREYFPAETVVAGLFEVVKRIFGVSVKQRPDVKTYDSDVHYYDLFDESGKHIAGFYLDMFARDRKNSGAWMSTAVSPRLLADGSRVVPVAYAVLNASKGSDGKKSLFYHRDVTTLFHEFGHALHLMLTKVDISAVAGTRVAWDVVEYPSQMLEGWTWNKEALALLSGHYQTGERLSDEMLDKLLAAKNFQAARSLVRQLEFGLFDFILFSSKEQVEKDTVAKLREWIKQNVGIDNEPEWTRRFNAFGHIFAGGYAAGYYGYLWSEVLAIDTFEAFVQAGIFNREFGQKFVDGFLSKGGSDEPMKLYREFMGREPSVDALLHDRGIK